MSLRNSGSKLILAVLVAIIVIGGVATWRETRTAAYVDIPAPTATASPAAATSAAAVTRPATATRPATPAPATSEAEDSGSDGSGDG